FCALAGASALGGRVKPGHDNLGYDAGAVFRDASVARGVLKIGKFCALTDVSALGGRVKPGHDNLGYDVSAVSATPFRCAGRVEDREVLCAHGRERAGWPGQARP